MVTKVPQQFPPATSPFLTRDGLISVVWYQYLVNNQNQVSQNTNYVTNITTTDVPEGTNLYFTAARSRGSIAVYGGLTYNNITGLISSGTAAGADTGTGGHTVPYLDADNTFGGTQTFNNLTVTGTISGSISQANKWSTARTLSFTGDVTGSGSVDGSVNVATAMTLATVNSTTGTFGSSSAVPVVTVNGKGLITNVTTAALGTAAVKDIGTSGATVPLLNGTNTWSGAQTFALPAILPASTVAALPSASLYPNGVAIATDLSGPFSIGNIISGGGSNRGLIVSDGTNWRIG